MMKRTGRLRWSGAIVAAFLAFTPLLGMGTVASAQSGNDAESFLTDAQGLTDELTPIVDQDSFSITQSTDTIAAQKLNTDPIENFYLEFTVEAPRDGATDPFDFGLFFRDLGDDYYGLAISSSAGGNGPAWGLVLGQKDADPTSADSGDLSAKDFPTDEGSTYDVVVAAIGDDAAFSVNGTAVAMLDISDQPDAGDIALASGFFSSSSVAGEDIPFSNVTLYDLNAATGSTGSTEASPTAESGNGNGNTEGQTEGRPTATAEGGDETPDTGDETPDTGDETPDTGSVGYESPDYGYTLSFDDTWSIADQSEKDGNDYVNLTNGTSTVLIFGQAYTGTAKACVDSDIKFFQDTANGYTFDGTATDTDGNELTGELSTGGYYAVLWVTDKNGDAQTVYVECRPIVEGESMMLIEQYVADADYNDQIDARKTLLAGLAIAGGGGAGPDETSTPEEDVTPTTNADELDVTLDAVDRSGVSGDAVLTPSGTTRTRVVATVDGAPEGALVVLQEGSCDSLSGNADFDAGEIDENGESSARVLATLDDLSGNYALTIIDPDTEDYETPLACGDI
jgi:hypothetical protein